jgi:hypothetical protein
MTDEKTIIDRLTIENWQLKGALGYEVPGDIPEGPFKCGLCKARRINDGWFPIETAPIDGTHILACLGPYGDHVGFNQRPPVVVHYFADPEKPGFYQSSGIVQDSYNDLPYQLTHWMPLERPPSP